MKIPRSVFQERWDKLVSTDTIRVLKIVEIAQYTILYFALSVVVARFVNGVYYEKVKDSREQEHRKRQRSIPDLVKRLSILCMELFVLTVLIFYMRKLVLLVPSIASLYNKRFKPHTTMHFIVEITLMFAFMEMMPQFRIQFERLGEWLI